jgi:CubicO group peptidase (beta-lactamase class C family)
MRTRSFPAFLFLCLCLVTTAAAQNGEDALTKKIDQLFAVWDKPESPGAAIAIIKDGAVVYKHGYGSANLEASSEVSFERDEKGSVVGFTMKRHSQTRSARNVRFDKQNNQ